MKRSNQISPTVRQPVKKLLSECRGVWTVKITERRIRNGVSPVVDSESRPAFVIDARRSDNGRTLIRGVAVALTVLCVDSESGPAYLDRCPPQQKGAH